jgi:cytochrome c biogenesis protein CcmG, thiol:disulfide interchange protein DsbE
MTKQRAGRRRPTPPPNPRRPRSSTLMLGLGGLVIAVAAVAAIALTQPGTPAGSSGPSSSTPVVASAQVTGAALPAFVPGGEDPAVGRPIPEVEGASFDGTPVSIKADARPKLILFIAHWCPHCQREVPVVQSWIDANGMPDGVDLISVATAIDPTQPNYPPDAWLAREHWQPPVIVDADRRIATDYGLTAFPYWVAVGSNGTVASRLTGELTPEQLDAVVDSLTSG